MTFDPWLIFVWIWKSNNTHINVTNNTTQTEQNKNQKEHNSLVIKYSPIRAHTAPSRN